MASAASLLSVALFLAISSEFGVPPWTETLWVLDTGGLLERDVHRSPEGPPIAYAQVSEVDDSTGAILVFRSFPRARSVLEQVREAWHGPCGCAPASELRDYTPTGSTAPAVGTSFWKEFRLKP